MTVGPSGPVPSDPGSRSNNAPIPSCLGLCTPPPQLTLVTLSQSQLLNFRPLPLVTVCPPTPVLFQCIAVGLLPTVSPPS